MNTAELKTNYIDLIERLEDLINSPLIMEGDRLNIEAKLEVLKTLLDWY